MVRLQCIEKVEMATIRVELKPFLLSLAAVGVTEAMVIMAANRITIHPIFITGGIRMVEILMIGFIIGHVSHGLSAIGISKETAGQGLVRGMVWSLRFGLVVLAVFSGLFLMGINPVRLIGVRLPSGYLNLIGFFFVGGLISPIAEEMFFRGVVFGFLRRWGFWLAMIVSTGVFVLPHLSGVGVPLTQVAGGIVFAAAYEKTGSLITAITVHVLGNLAIFGLSFFRPMLG